jgi:hypothetical protein
MSLFSKSRRDFLARSIASGTAIVLYDTFGSADLFAGEDWDSQTELEEHLRVVNNNLADASPEMQDYLKHSEIVRATTSSGEFHETYNNSYQIVHEQRQSFSTQTSFTGYKDESSGILWVGINLHPWSWIASEYRPNLTLNNAELEVLKKTNDSFTEIAKWKNETLVVVPFPDSPRLVVEQQHLDGFARLLKKNDIDPDQHELRYVRYFLSATRKGSDSSLRMKVITAYAHTRKGGSKSSLKIDYHVTYA